MHVNWIPGWLSYCLRHVLNVKSWAWDLIWQDRRYLTLAHSRVWALVNHTTADQISVKSVKAQIYTGCISVNIPRVKLNCVFASDPSSSWFDLGLPTLSRSTGSDPEPSSKTVPSLARTCGLDGDRAGEVWKQTWCKRVGKWRLFVVPDKHYSLSCMYLVNT